MPIDYTIESERRTKRVEQENVYLVDAAHLARILEEDFRRQYNYYGDWEVSITWNAPYGYFDGVEITASLTVEEDLSPKKQPIPGV